MSGFRRSGGTDLDNVFEPASPGMSSTQGAFRGSGGQLTYCPIQFGTQAAATSMRLSNGADLNTQWAAKGSVGYLANPQTWQNTNFAEISYTQYNSAVALPSPAFIVACSSINGGDHQTCVVRITFNPDGTWIASAAATNRYNDADSWWNSYGSGFQQNLYNIGQGNFTTNLANPIANPGTVTTFQGNWLKNPSAGAGANYLISASFSAVYDYTATSKDITGTAVNYTQGLRGATSGMQIYCNGGFVVDAGGNWYPSVSNMSLANPVSICYEWNSAGGFGGNLTSFEGPNGALSWLTYVMATVTLANTSGSVSATNSLAMGALMSWEQYNSGYGTAWPPTYSGNHALDGAPWTNVNVGAGSQGQWAWSTGGGGGGGGGVGCVEVSMYAKEGLRIGEVTKTSAVDGVAFHPDRIQSQAVNGVKHSVQPCYLLVTESDIEVVLSDSTPMPLRHGGYKKLPRMLGEEVLVDDNGVIRWERVKRLDLLGMRTVALLDMEYQCYLAGRDPKRRVATHTPHPEYSAKHFSPRMLAIARPNLKAAQ
jgi:hypothetical protein